MKSKSGFTIVELIVVIVVIGILAGLSIFSYSKTQADSRDNRRLSIVTTAQEALEKYYQKNGEYPPVRNMVNSYSGNTGSTVATMLVITPSDLLMPQLPAGTTNPFTSNATPTNDNISYIASDTANNTNCQTSTTGGCDQYTLKYNKENGGLTTVSSRHHP